MKTFNFDDAYDKLTAHFDYLEIWHNIKPFFTCKLHWYDDSATFWIKADKARLIAKAFIDIAEILESMAMEAEKIEGDNI